MYVQHTLLQHLIVPILTRVREYSNGPNFLQLFSYFKMIIFLLYFVQMKKKITFEHGGRFMYFFEGRQGNSCFTRTSCGNRGMTLIQIGTLNDNSANGNAIIAVIQNSRIIGLIHWEFRVEDIVTDTKIIVPASSSEHTRSGQARDPFVRIPEKNQGKNHQSLHLCFVSSSLFLIK